ncbi:hypothetical protein [Pseudomonas huaxiensis]|nr:hypothetical protein [Pseudomonas huaxiensis]
MQHLNGFVLVFSCKPQATSFKKKPPLSGVQLLLVSRPQAEADTS